MNELDKYIPSRLAGGYGCQICPATFLSRTPTRAHSEVIAHLRLHRKNELYAERLPIHEALR